MGPYYIFSSICVIYTGYSTSLTWLYRRLGIFLTKFYLFCPSISLKWLYFDWYCCNCLPHKIPLNYMTYPSKILFLRIFNCKFSHFYPFLPNFTPVSVPVRPQKMFILANNKIWLCRILSCIYVIFTLILTYLREF